MTKSTISENLIICFVRRAYYIICLGRYTLYNVIAIGMGWLMHNGDNYDENYFHGFEMIQNDSVRDCICGWDLFASLVVWNPKDFFRFFSQQVVLV